MGQPHIPEPRSRFTGGCLFWFVTVTLGLLCCVGGTIFAVNQWHGMSREQGPAEQTAHTYLDAILADDLTTAYAQTCDSIHARMTPAQFDLFQSHRDEIGSYDILGVNLASTNGRMSGSVDTTMHLTAGGTFGQRIELVKEHDRWRVCE